MGGELPNLEDGGLPAGVNDIKDEPGGGPAGVVDGFEAKLLVKGLLFRLLSGVDGGLEEKGTWNVDMASEVERRMRWWEDRRSTAHTML